MAQRPQVNTDLGGPQPIQAVARPQRETASVFSVGQSRAGALAQSLVGLAPTLSGYVGELQDDYRKSEEERAYDTIQGMTHDQAKAAVKSGEMRDTESPWYQAAFEKQFGMAYATRRKQDIINRYNNEFDKSGGNVDEFLAQFAAEDLDKFGGSEFIMSGYRDKMAGVLDQVRNDHAQYNSELTKERTVGNFGQIARDAINEATRLGDNPMEAVRVLYGDHKEAFGLTYGELDSTLFGLAQEYAEAGDVATVEAILGYEVTAEDGTKVGSFMTRPKYALDSEELIARARAQQGEDNRAVNGEAITDLQSRASSGSLSEDDFSHIDDLVNDEQMTSREREALLRQHKQAKVNRIGSEFVREQTAIVRGDATRAVTQGKAWLVRDQEIENPATGKVTTLRAEDLIEEAAIGALDTLAAGGASPQRMATELSSYGTDVTYPEWETSMSNGYLALTQALVSDDKDGQKQLPDVAVAGYNTWKALSDDPNLRSRHVTDATAAQVYRDAYTLESIMRVPMEDALLRSAAIDRSGRTSASHSLTRDQIDGIVSEGNLFGDDVANAAYLTDSIEESARILVDLGVPPKRAVKAATDRFWESHTVINGSTINTDSVYLPKDFEETSRVALERFAEEHDEDVDDLTFTPARDGSNYWMVSYKGMAGLGVSVAGADSNRFHVSYFQNLTREKAEADLAATNEAIKERADKDASFDPKREMREELRQADDLFEDFPNPANR